MTNGLQLVTFSSVSNVIGLLSWDKFDSIWIRHVTIPAPQESLLTKILTKLFGQFKKGKKINNGKKFNIGKNLNVGKGPMVFSLSSWFGLARNLGSPNPVRMLRNAWGEFLGLVWANLKNQYYGGGRKVIPYVWSVKSWVVLNWKQLTTHEQPKFLFYSTHCANYFFRVFAKWFFNFFV